jgi:probable HAF family extracellular repeat protein
LGRLPGSTFSEASDINDAGQVVGISQFSNGNTHATEWSGGKVIDLGALPGFTGSQAVGINDRGQVVGSSFGGSSQLATEWSDDSVINLGTLGTGSIAYDINDAGLAVGISGSSPSFAVEWSDGSVINLGGLNVGGIRALQGIPRASITLGRWWDIVKASLPQNPRPGR